MFLAPEDLKKALDSFKESYFYPDIRDTSWLAKIESTPSNLDLIFGTRNGQLSIEREWFKYCRPVEMMRRENIHVLDGSSCRIGKVDFIGTKGFCGGFGRLLVQPFGEQALKTFIRTGIDEVVRMERELSAAKGPHKVAVLHYSPVKGTLKGEEPELFPFLVSSRLGDVLDAYGVDIGFHGHAHHGSPVGYTRTSIPIHNVCRFVQKRAAHSELFTWAVQ